MYNQIAPYLVLLSIITTGVSLFFILTKEDSVFPYIAMPFVFVFFGFLELRSRGKDDAAEYFCYSHGGLATVNRRTYKEFICNDGSHWRVSLQQVNGEF